MIKLRYGRKEYEVTKTGNTWTATRLYPTGKLKPMGQFKSKEAALAAVALDAADEANGV